jgi:hypothetical protein
LSRHNDQGRYSVLVHIQADEKLDTLIHGRSSLLVAATRSQHVARRGLPHNLRRGDRPSVLHKATILSKAC